MVGLGLPALTGCRRIGAWASGSPRTAKKADLGYGYTSEVAYTCDLTVFLGSLIKAVAEKNCRKGFHYPARFWGTRGNANHERTAIGHI